MYFLLSLVRPYIFLIYFIDYFYNFFFLNKFVVCFFSSILSLFILLIFSFFPLLHILIIILISLNYSEPSPHIYTLVN